MSEDGRQLSAGVDSSPGLATTLVRALDAAGVLVDNIEVRQPSLDDVFFTLTGDHIEEDVAGDDGADGDDGGRGGGRGPSGVDPSLDGNGRAAELEGANA